MTTIDLRSDTVTQPSAAMRAAMAAAATGDDVYGEDPSVNALEARVAALFGKQAALLCTSGTQSNLLALLSQCQRGEEYLVGEEYHTYRYEAGGAAVLGGIVPQTVPVLSDGSLDLAVLATKVKADDPHFPITRLLALENTHTGKVIPAEFFTAAREFANTHGLRLHLDGARLFNAHIATKQPLIEMAAPFDSVSVCLSKGLGAPIGSMLVADASTVRIARRWRKMLGGGMRQAGIVAAGLDYALDHNIQRLADDHQCAIELAKALQAGYTAQGMNTVTVQPPQTNMVYLDFSSAEVAATVAKSCKEQGILVPSSKRMRLVTHLDVPASAIHRVAEVIVAASASG